MSKRQKLIVTIDAEESGVRFLPALPDNEAYEGVSEAADALIAAVHEALEIGHKPGYSEGVKRETENKRLARNTADRARYAEKAKK